MDIKASSSGFHEEIALQCRPIFFRLDTELQDYDQLLGSDNSIQVCDQILGQLEDLIKCRNPSRKIESEEYEELVKNHLSGRELKTYGVWVYYPWCKKMVHLLDEEEFIEVRTNRNKYKLTDDEQQVLRSKKIGIIGLSVGQSIALTLAMERTCGELRLADFDTIELSNLNRIRTGVQSLGLKKTIVAAREIAEIDPFLKVKVFSDGLTYENIDKFFSGDGQLDILVEVCDSLDMKINCRFKAKELNIPVVMDTNDRGMLDIERFDLDPDMQILHGLAEGLNPDNIKDLTNEEKIPHILRMVGAGTLSPRLKASMLEVRTTLCTWPQLASSVVLGGAITTDVCRRILLNQLSVSGRYYVDLDELIKDPQPKIPENSDSLSQTNGQARLELISEYFKNEVEENKSVVVEEIGEILESLKVVPDFGGEFHLAHIYERGILLLFQDQVPQNSWLDSLGIDGCLTVGSSLESLALKSLSMGFRATIDLLPLKDSPQLIAAISFHKAEGTQRSSIGKPGEYHALELSQADLRSGEPLPLDFYKQIEYFVAEFQRVEIYHTDRREDIADLAQIAGDLSRRILLDERGHREYFKRLIRNESGHHTIEANDKIKFSVFNLVEDWRAMRILRELGGGSALRSISTLETKSASGVILFKMNGFSVEKWVNAGRAFERLYRYATSQGVPVEPLTCIHALFNGYNHGHLTGIDETFRQELSTSWQQFKKVFSQVEDNSTLFLIKLGGAERQRLKYRRINTDEISQTG